MACVWWCLGGPDISLTSVGVATFVTLALEVSTPLQPLFCGSVYVLCNCSQAFKPSVFGAGFGCNVFFQPTPRACRYHVIRSRTSTGCTGCFLLKCAANGLGKTVISIPVVNCTKHESALDLTLSCSVWQDP